MTPFTAWISKIRLVSFALTSPRTECEPLNEGNSFQTHSHQQLLENKSPRLPGGEIITACLSVGHLFCRIFCAQCHDFMVLFIFSVEFTRLVAMGNVAFVWDNLLYLHHTHTRTILPIYCSNSK